MTQTLEPRDIVEVVDVQTTLTVEDLTAAMRARKEADQEYWELVAKARAAGWSNTKIASAVGVSEAAIRLYFRRRTQSSRY